MFTKHSIQIAFFALAGSLCLGAQTGTPNNSGPMVPKAEQQPVMPSQQPGQPKVMKKAGCSQLSPDEQDFAGELSPSQKMVFCNKFDPGMRTSAMEMSGQMGDDGMLMTNDQAVESVAKDNGILMPVMGTQPQQRKSGSCPAK
ncbi:MAG: hypothetical protein ACHQT8_03810 [Chlamydiales bacterium]